jgi:hypothetical protein
MKRSMKFTRIGVLFALLLSLIPAGIAYADSSTQTTLNTSAVVDGSGDPPTVDFKWELPDTDPSTCATIEYGNDADPSTNSGVQVVPNLEDLPCVEHIAYWWVASDPYGIDNIIQAYVRVYHPDGSLKYQLHATTDGGQNSPIAPVPCADLGDANDPATPLGAAVLTGQLTSAQVQLIVDNCNKNVSLVFMVSGEISKEQPCGDYTVIASVSDKNGVIGSLTNTMTVECVVGLWTDFSKVDFGSISPNTGKWVRGDTTFDDPVDSGLPSVKNVGNTNMYLELKYGEMKGADQQKTIDSFDAQLNSQKFDPMDAGTTYCFYDQPLGSNVVGQIDFSIHPGSIPADTYSGKLWLTGVTACP